MNERLFFRSNLYVDDQKIVNNDGNPQYATSRCSTTTLSSGSHVLYIEGWSRSSLLSISATFQGADTMNQASPFSPCKYNPLAPPKRVSVFSECNPTGVRSGDNNFTLCTFKIDNALNLWHVDDAFTYYQQVTEKMP